MIKYQNNYLTFSHDFHLRSFYTSFPRGRKVIFLILSFITPNIKSSTFESFNWKTTIKTNKFRRI